MSCALQLSRIDATYSVAGRVNQLGHRLALRRDDRVAHPAVGVIVPALDQAEAFQSSDLAADRRVVAPDTVSELHDADRPESLHRNQQRKQRPVERNSGFLDQRVIALRPVDDRDDIQQRPVKLS